MVNDISQREFERKNLDIKNVVQSSNKLLKNFKVYIAVYESDSRHQTSHITKEEYDKMQKYKFIGSKHEDKFFENLPDIYGYIDSKTLVLSNDNYGLAFHPMIWHVLTTEERLTACRIAWKDIYHRDIKEFCNYNSNGVALVGKDYQGALNIGSFFRDDVISSDILRGIFDANNKIKDSFYSNRLMHGKKIDTIKDFDSFEEMQYLSPLEPKEQDLNKMSKESKAFYFDGIYFRRFREAIQKSLDLITLHGKELEGLFPEFERYVRHEQKSITDTNLFVMSVLGSNVIERDKKYLEIKSYMFDSFRVERHNQLYKEFVKVKKEKVDVINKPYKDQLNLLEQEKEKINNQIKNANDAIDIWDLQHKLKKLEEKELKLKNKMAINHNKILKPILEAVKKNDSQKVSYEQALEHFNDYFENKNKHQNKKITKQIKSNENYMELN